ncbi:hypothetical protein H257_07447 [Aphanomyces astaci]|uniref:Uncharacterized protein n=1 Tax=Aphanomyces astaci TaxID=112090 RepID=W4GJC5_APHAT|nr:hypothetical protein H257_07447 [Aphanomyces astaci]ETV79436.1 hypothetical protein H257_07447 [Aphanomyces astaci]|eukprot:XP_009831277.1 hypothetical protein H257_07447 [Aphanomyces astaci]
MTWHTPSLATAGNTSALSLSRDGAQNICAPRTTAPHTAQVRMWEALSRTWLRSCLKDMWRRWDGRLGPGSTQHPSVARGTAPMQDGSAVGVCCHKCAAALNWTRPSKSTRRAKT